MPLTSQQASDALFDAVEAYFTNYVPTAEDDEWDMYVAYEDCCEAAE
jgi:hypothetical protein